MKKLYNVLVATILVSLVLAACGGGANAKPKNLLEAIKQRGYILVSTDPNYKPQSFLNTESKRPADTRCPSEAYTATEMQGFDVDVAKAISEALAVEACFQTPSWDAITAGNWSGKWDISVGSMTISTSRRQNLDFSVPYYYAPTVVAVRADSGITELAGLEGQSLCVGDSTTYEQWLNHDMEGLGLPKSYIYADAPNVTVISLETDLQCAQAISAGRNDFIGYVTSETVVNANIAAGFPVVKIGGPVFVEDLAAAFDKSSSLSTDTLRTEVDELFTKMHSDGSLTELSTKWFKDESGEGVDYTVRPK